MNPSDVFTTTLRTARPSEVVEERVKAERRAIEADFERRVRQRTEACDQSRPVLRGPAR